MSAGTLLNKYSSRITQPTSQGASQAMLMATGLRPDDLNKPQVGICSVWYEGNPCNMHLGRLGDVVKEGVVAAGCVGMRFNTIGVSDGISMGTSASCAGTSPPTGASRMNRLHRLSLPPQARRNGREA